MIRTSMTSKIDGVCRTLGVRSLPIRRASSRELGLLVQTEAGGRDALLHAARQAGLSSVPWAVRRVLSEMQDQAFGIWLLYAKDLVVPIDAMALMRGLMAGHGMDCGEGRIDQIMAFIASQSSMPAREHSQPRGVSHQGNALIDRQMAEFIDKVGAVLSVPQIVIAPLIAYLIICDVS